MSDSWGYAGGSRQSGSRDFRSHHGTERSDSRRNDRHRDNDTSSSRAHRKYTEQHEEEVCQNKRAATCTVIRAPYDVINTLSARGEAKIRELQDQTGAKIKVLHHDDNWEDIGVELSGEVDQIKYAEKLIKELKGTPASASTNIDHSSQESHRSSNIPTGGWGTEDMDTSNQKPQWESERKSYAERKPRQQFESSRRQNYSPERQSQQSGNSMTMTVPSSSVGRIIGRGGSKINELQSQSGARIKVLKDDSYGSDTSIQITGDSQQQKEAERMIKELLDDNPFSGSRYPNSSEPKTSMAQTNESAVVDWGAVIKESKEASLRRWANSPPLAKNFYIEDPDVSVMSREDVAKFRLTHNNITVSHYKEDDDRPIPNPVTNFAQAFSHFPEILEAVQNQSFKDPSPIQSQAWPVLLKGCDMIGIAQTGTGKTLAFLLPAFVHIEGQPVPRSERSGPTVLIMAPTRELAQQIEREVAKFPYKGIKCLCVYGGGDRRTQMGAISKGVEIVVATPGRLYDLMQAGALKTSSVSYVVLDEADRMLDLGFEPQIKKILIDVRPDRQTIMTSATWPEGVRRIANEYMNNPIQVCVGTLDLAAVHSITQHVEILDEEDKRRRLLDFIHSLDAADKAIIFVGRKLVADQIASELSLDGIVCQCIHGNREQSDREQALEDLRNGDVRLLIATDVASRGIDIKDITHILNYDFPRHAEEYVHRVGRTGRAGRSGIAISFMTREDWSKAQDLIDILQEAKQEIPSELLKMAERFAAWKERKEEERHKNMTDMGSGGGGGFRGRGGGRGRGGRRDDGFGFGFGGSRRGGSRDFF